MDTTSPTAAVPELIVRLNRAHEEVEAYVWDSFGSMSAFPDSKPLTDGQRRKLCHMLYMAMLEMRTAGWAGKAEQAADLADAFHNLPTGMWHEDFSLEFFRKFLESYRQKYPDAFNYLAALEEVRDLGGKS